MVNQYDVIKLNLNPVIGNEKGNYRPCLVISDTEFNRISGFVCVMPITSRLNERYPTDVIVETENQKISGVVDCAQIKAIDIHARSYKHFDTLTTEKVMEVKDILKNLLSI